MVEEHNSPPDNDATTCTTSFFFFASSNPHSFLFLTRFIALDIEDSASSTLDVYSVINSMVKYIHKKLLFMNYTWRANDKIHDT